MAITFKDRVSENPNRRKLTVVSSTNGEIQIADEIVVDVERDEGTIVPGNEGTPLSANVLNSNLMVADAVIRNQAEFDALVGQFHATLGSSKAEVIAACPKTIVLVGGGGSSPNGAYTVPLDGINLPWVKTGYFHLQGINGAKLYWDSTGIEGDRSAINGGVDSIDDADGTFLIENVSLIITGTTTNLRVSGFNGCANLDNCFVVADNFSASYYSNSCFYKCYNCNNCMAILNDINSNGSRSFAECVNLTNCTGIATGSGFGACTNLTNCTGVGTMTAMGFAVGFSSCTNLTNCIGTGAHAGASSANGQGFSSCTNLTNCIGKGTGTGNSYGFYGCTRASNCKDNGSTTGMWGDTNKAIDPVTCKKTPATADNSTLNA